MIGFIFIWVVGAVATLCRYYDSGRDMYRPGMGPFIRKPYRMLFRDWALIVFAWPAVVSWAVFAEIKRGW